MRAPAHRAGHLAHAAQRVVGVVAPAHFGRRLGQQEQIALLGHQEKDQPVDQPPQLLVVRLRAQFAALQPCAQRLVGPLRQKAAAQRRNRLGHTLAQRVHRPCALRRGQLRPAFEPGRRGSRV